ncbi:MAG TPA: hypothetical protein VJ714_11475 [Anaerolineae bacterium]|nr:hypothetical protein [Anaerolineae bacterium]
MVRRFNLADVLLVKRLQEQAACLDLETALLWSPAPLSLALLEYLSLSQARSTTFVENGSSGRQSPQGFLQAWDRSDGVACDVEFIAPPLNNSTDNFRLWCDFLEHLTVSKGASRVQRIFARVPQDGRAVEAFRNTGFTAYARRHVFRLVQIPAVLPGAGGDFLRPLRGGDDSKVHSLRSSVTPRLVQHAEGAPHAEHDPTALLPWWKSHQTREYVWEQDGAVRAYLRFLIGQDGHWLRILFDPAMGRQVDDLVSDALALITSLPALPVYCSVREYEGPLRGALESAGFDSLATEVLMVKHTTVPARIAVNKLSPALEKGVETAAPVSTSESRETGI